MAHRIVSFLPSATEMVCALGLEERLMGITHECDYPPQIRNRPVVVRSVLPTERMTQQEIDTAVTERLRNGQSLYEVDDSLLREIAPDLILTQDLCQVCAASGNEVSRVLDALPEKPQVLWLTPKSLADIFDNLHELGAATDRSRQADDLIASSRARLDSIIAGTRKISIRPRVFCMEWLDPIYCSGHWVPEMIVLAGGRDDLGRAGTDSIRISWQDVVQWAPEILIVMLCGTGLEKAAAQAQQLLGYPDWSVLPAAQNNRVYVVDANSYFARPGPRIIDGAELLAHLIHPDLFGWNGPQRAFQRIGLPFVSGDVTTAVGA